MSEKMERVKTTDSSCSWYENQEFRPFFQEERLLLDFVIRVKNENIQESF